MCTDFSGFTAPLWQEVRDEVAYDPTGAQVLAEAVRASVRVEMQQRQQDLDQVGQEQVDVAEGVAGPAYARPGGSGTAGQFTTASQIQRWAAGGGQYQHQGQGQGQGQHDVGMGAGPGMFF